jgi:hypothetical protein
MHGPPVVADVPRVENPIAVLVPDDVRRIVPIKLGRRPGSINDRSRFRDAKQF